MATYVKTNWLDDVTPLSAANLNKIEGGVFDALATGTYFAGTILTAAVANQKVDLTFPNVSFHGYLEVIVVGQWNGTNGYGLVSKKFSLIWTNPSAINAQSTEYDTVAGNAASIVSINDITYDATVQKFKTIISFQSPGVNRWGVFVRGYSLDNTTYEKITSLAALSAVYTTNATVYPLPVRNFVRQIRSDVPQGTAPFPVTSTTVNTNFTADSVDGVHFSTANGYLEFDDGSGMKPVSANLGEVYKNPLYAASATAAAVTGTWYTAVNITGKGYIDRAVAWGFGGSLGSYYWGLIRITIDGVARLTCRWGAGNNGSNNYGHVGGMMEARNVGVGYQVGRTNNDMMDFYWNNIITTALPFTASAPTAANQSDLFLAPGPMFFNTSLKIEVLMTNSAGGNISYNVRGGLV